MSANRERQLIDLLDRTLPAEQVQELRNSLRSDGELAAQWQTLKLAVEAIEYAGLREQVLHVGRTWSESRGQVGANRPMAVVRTLYRNAMRVAACILILAGSTLVYKYVTISSDKLVGKYYQSFELGTSRGGASSSPLDQAFRGRNWTQVVKLANGSAQKDNKTFFLAGMAQMELKQFDQATSDFRQVLAANSGSGTGYFQDEAEYFLALSLLASHQVKEASQILDKIAADPHQVYHQKAAEIKGLDLRLLIFKDSK
jgi:hypothetical protein